MIEFPSRKWNKYVLNRLIRQTDAKGTSNNRNCGRKRFSLTTAHRSRHTVAYLNANVPELIEPENWPSNSPDLNPVDYSIWSCLQQLVYREPIRDVEHLVAVWAKGTQISLRVVE